MITAQFNGYRGRVAVSLLFGLLVLFFGDHSIGALLFFIPALLLQIFCNPFLSWMIVAPVISIGISIITETTAKNAIFWNIFEVLILLLGIILLTFRRFLQYRAARPYVDRINTENESDEQLTFSDKAMHEASMTDSERNFFKSEMTSHYEKYQYLVSVRQDMSKQVPTYSNDLKIIQGIFDELVTSPRQLLNGSDFMYKHLPDYTQLTHGLLALSNNLVHSDEDTDIIDETKRKLSMMSKLLRQDFIDVTNDERTQLRTQLDSMDKEDE